MKPTAVILLISLSLISCNSTKVSSVEVLHVTPYFHGPSHGVGLIEIEQELSYFEEDIINNQPASRPKFEFFTIIEPTVINTLEKLLLQREPLPEFWYDSLIASRYKPKIKPYYSDIDSVELEKKLKSHMVNIEYRLSFFDTDGDMLYVAFVGHWNYDLIEDVMLINEEYFRVSKHLFPQVDSILLPLCPSYEPFE